jgi:hypothetical protein
MACPKLNIFLNKRKKTTIEGSNITYNGISNILLNITTTQPLPPNVGNISGLMVLKTNTSQINYTISPSTTSIYGATVLNLVDTTNTLLLDFVQEITYDVNAAGCNYVGTITDFDWNCEESTETFGDTPTFIEIDSLCTLKIEVGGDRLGCTISGATNYDPFATINDGSCIGLISGCTNPDSGNYNPLANFDDGSCLPKIFGCINPDAINFNPNANTDDGSCLFVPQIPKRGCTNCLASNYDPTAIINDGSCIFISGCTYEFATNYNPLAVIDDFSCYCDTVEYILDLNGETDFFFSSTGDTLDTECRYYSIFSYRIQLDCKKIIDYLLDNPELTPFTLLRQLKMNFKAGEFNVPVFEVLEENDIYDIEFIGEQEDCKYLIELLATELGYACGTDILPKFRKVWKEALVEIVELGLDTDVNLSLFLQGVPYGACILVNNFKIERACATLTKECIIVPYTFGFDLHTIKDNVKSTTENNPLILNTKLLDVKVNISKYITDDIKKYLELNKKIIHPIFRKTNEEFKDNYIYVQRALTDDCYYFYHHIYQNYLESFKYCSAKSKALDYKFYFEALDKIGTDWYDTIKQFIPETSIWQDNNRYYANIELHSQKFKYKTSSLLYGNIDCNHETFGVEIECFVVKDKGCEIEPEELTYNIDTYPCDFLGVSGSTFTNKVTYLNFNKTVSNAVGRILQISDDPNYPNILECYDSTIIVYGLSYNYPKLIYPNC